MLIVDGTDFRRREPFPFVKEENKKWYSHKFKGAAFRWELASSVKTGRLCWFNGPFPCGIMPDLRIFWSNLKTLLLPSEGVLVDKGYKGDAKCITPFDAKCKRHRKAMSQLRARHETINGRLKNWECLYQTWRHHQHKHSFAVKAVLVITQLELIHRDPLFSVVYKDPVLI